VFGDPNHELVCYPYSGFLLKIIGLEAHSATYKALN